MQINNDQSQPVTIQTADLDWVPSPSPGVDRKMLYREGGEVARATSLVRYAAGSAFPAHEHTGGEEILVLSGTFQDEHGDYPAGCYFRNPPGTSHSPAAEAGCTIFVRLWQFREGDSVQIVRQPETGDAVAAFARDGSARLLFEDPAERVTLEDWPAHASFEIGNARGLELLVLEGDLQVDGTAMSPETWLRRPAGQPMQVSVGERGARVWVKDASLRHADILPMPEAR